MVERLPILFYNKYAFNSILVRVLCFFLKSHSKGMIEIPKHILTTIMCISCVEISGGFYFALSNRHFKTLLSSMWLIAYQTKVLCLKSCVLESPMKVRLVLLPNQPNFVKLFGSFTK